MGAWDSVAPLANAPAAAPADAPAGGSVWDGVTPVASGSPSAPPLTDYAQKKLAAISVKPSDDRPGFSRDISPDEFAADDAAIAAREAASVKSPPNLAHNAAVVGSGINEGLANTAGFPVDLAADFWNVPSRLFGGPEIKNPVGGSDWIKQQLANAGVPPVQPESAGERFAHRTAQDVGAAIAPWGAAAGLAKAGIGVARPIIGPMLRSIQAAPAADAGLNAGMSTLSGGGAAAGQAMAPNSPNTQTIGSLAGGVGVPALAATGGRLATAGWNAVRSIFPSEANAGRSVANILRQNTALPDTLGERVAAARQQPQSVPGFQPTTGQATNDPGILALERGVVRDPLVTAAATQHRTGQNLSIAHALREALPTITDEQINNLIQRVSGRVQALGPGATPDAAGQILREEMASQRQQLVTARSEMSGHLYAQAADDATRQRDILDGLKALAKGAPNPEIAAAIKEIEKAARLNPGPAMRPVAKEAAEAKNPGTLADLEMVLRTFARKGTGEADYTASGLMNTSKALGQIAANHAVDPFVRGVAKNAQRNLDDIIAGQVPSYRAARAAYREGSPPINAMEEGPVGKVLSQDHLTKRFDTPDSAVAEKFFNSRTGSQEAAADFMKTVGSRPRAIKAMEDYIAGQVLDPRNGMIDAAGRVNAKALRRFIDDHQEALKSFPSVAGKMRNINLAQSVVDNLQARRDLADKLFRTLVRGEEATPELAVASFNNFIRSNRAEIERLLPGQYERLERIGETGLVAQRTEKARQKGGSDTNEETRKSNVIGTMIGTAAKKAAPSAAGGVLGYLLGGALGGAAGAAGAQGVSELIAAQGRAVTTLLGKALLDPSVAETLLMRYRPAAAPQIQSRIRAHLANVPVAAMGGPGPDSRSGSAR